MSKIRVLLADDHRLFREGLRQICEVLGDFIVVGEATHGQEAVALAVQLEPDVILMDIRMPGLDGVQATQQISERLHSTGVIILTMYRQENYVFEAIKAGARGYLLKDTDSRTLIETVCAVQRGEAMLDPGMAARVLAEFRRISQVAAGMDEVAKLTDGETDVLRMVVEGADNKAIAARLSLSENTVANRLREIYQKLHVNNRTQAALTAVRRGIVSLDADT
ncbi:MAG: response regulator transcription factor [Anaerolineae bacterium]|nr:response regulator transcription factor [Anaerolineae bacterium]